MRRRLKGIYQCLSGQAAFEAAKLLGGDDDHLVSSMNGHVLRTFAVYKSHQLAKTRLGILQEPVPRCLARRLGFARLDAGRGCL